MRENWLRAVVSRRLGRIGSATAQLRATLLRVEATGSVAMTELAYLHQVVTRSTSGPLRTVARDTANPTVFPWEDPRLAQITVCYLARQLAILDAAGADISAIVAAARPSGGR